MLINMILLWRLILKTSFSLCRRAGTPIILVVCLCRSLLLKTILSKSRFPVATASWETTSHKIKKKLRHENVAVQALK